MEVAVFWLNIIMADYDLSYMTMSYDQCREAMIEYIKTEPVYYIGCDVNPIDGAINLPGGYRRHGR